MEMRYLAFVIFIFEALSVSGQTHRKCRIFQYYGIDSLHKKLVCTQIFNEKGKVLKEVCNGYYESRNSQGTDLIHVKDDGTRYYYYNDTLLVQSKLVLPNK